MQRSVLLEAASTAEAALGSSLEMLYYSLSSFFIFLVGFLFCLRQPMHTDTAKRLLQKASCCSIQGGGKGSWGPAEQTHLPSLTSCP